jgi:hypothetical protein
MTKTFYVVVPYSSTATGEIARTFGFGKKSNSSSIVVDDDFERNRVQLEQRMSLAASGLSASGLRAVPLGTEEIIELLYRSFNMGDMENPIRFTNA